MTQNQAPQYRKTRQGEWVVFGPATAVRKGLVDVTKKDGTTKTERVVRVGKTFAVDGVECCYGYIGSRTSYYYEGGGRHYSDRYCDACGHDAEACADMDCACRTCGGMMR